MRLIDADAIVFTHAIARSIDDGHNWNELCVTKGEIDDMPSAEPDNQVHLCSFCKYGYPKCPAEGSDVIFGNGKGHDNVCACTKFEIKPERTAKVQILPRRSETSMSWEGKCSNCGSYTIHEMNYCFECGAKLEWE